MNLVSYLPYIDAYSFLIYFLLAIFILYKNPQSSLNRTCAAFLLCFCLWSFSFIFIRNPYAAKNTIRFFYNLSSFGWISFASFFLWFALIFTKKARILNSKLFYLSIFLIPALLIYKQWRGFLLADYIKHPYGWSYSWTDSIWPHLYYFYYASFMFSGLILVFNFWQQSEDFTKRQQAKIIFTTTLIPFIFGSITNVLLPELDIYTIPPLANEIVLIWAVGVVYAIVRYKFLIIAPDTTADAIISTITDSLILLDSEGLIATVNKTAEDLLGYKKYELEGRPLNSIIFGDSAEALAAAILNKDKVPGRETIRDLELNLKDKGNCNILVNFSSSPLKDSKGNKFGTICIATDVTMRNNAINALSESEKRFRLLADNQTDFIVKLDLCNRFIFVSPSFCKLLVKKEEELLGRDFTTFIYEKDRDAVLEALNRLKRPPYNVYVEHEIMTRYGERWLAWTLRSFVDSSSKVSEILAIGDDITERKKSNEALKESEQKFKSLVERNSDFIWEMNRNCVYTYVNAKIKDILGYDARVVIGETPFYFMSEEEADRVSEFLKEKMEKREAFSGLETMNFHQDGYLVALETNAIPILDEKGELRSYRGISRDITKRKKFLDQLLHAAEEGRAVFDSITDMIIILDKDFRITRLNMAFAKALNMHPKEVIGKFCYSLIHGENKPCLNCPHKYAIERGLAQTLDLDFTVSKLGIHAQVSASPIFNKKGDTIGSVCIIKNITEKKEIDKDEELGQLGRLVADMARGMNDPLMIISGRAQLSLTEGIGDEDLRNNLKTILEESLSAKEMMSRLIAFSQPRKVDFKTLDINKSIEAAISVEEPRLKLVNIDIKRNYAKNLPYISGDERQLQEVILSLLNNAREAMPEEGGSITINTSLEDKFVKINCADTGRGMSREVLKRIFHPFFSTKERRVGLGLSLAYGIIKAHGGEIKFESKEGEGTSATILLPIK